MKIYDLVEKMIAEHKTIYDMPLRVTFYARVSTKRDEQLNSQENQIQTFTEMIQSNKNWTFVEGYVDTIRGENAAKRDSFLRMIADGENGMFDLIICKEISRFSRDILDSIRYTRELLRCDVGVLFSSDGLCTIDKDAELRLGIMSSIAQQEVARLSERVKFGHRKSIENGVVMGNSRIYGYDKQDKKLVINEKEAEMVRYIFETYSTGDYSLRQVENLLYEKGYRSRANGKIMHNTLKTIISNPKYKGYYCGNKVRIVDYRTKEQKFLPESEWIMYKDETGKTVPAIVSEELWERCNQIMSRRNSEVLRNVHGAKATSPLSGMIYCAAHNAPYYHNSYGHGTPQGIRYLWQCREKKGNSSNCASFSILDTELMKMLGDYFKILATNIDDYIDTYISIFKESISNSNVQNEVDKKKKEIDKLNAKKDKLLDLYSDDVITKTEFKSRNDKIISEVTELEDELNEMLAVKTNSDNVMTRIENIRKFFSTQFKSDEPMTDDLVIEICKNLVERIVVTPRDKFSMKITIVLNIGVSEDLVFNRLKRRSGRITKKMCPEVRMSFMRYNHYNNFTYYITSEV